LLSGRIFPFQDLRYFQLQRYFGFFQLWRTLELKHSFLFQISGAIVFTIPLNELLDPFTLPISSPAWCSDRGGYSPQFPGLRHFLSIFFPRLLSNLIFMVRFSHEFFFCLYLNRLLNGLFISPPFLPSLILSRGVSKYFPISIVDLLSLPNRSPLFPPDLLRKLSPFFFHLLCGSSRTSHVPYSPCEFLRSLPCVKSSFFP